MVFRSDKPGYFMAHWDALADNARVAGMQPGPTGLHPYLDNFVRLSRLPAATISEIRGRARGAGSEFVLATDIRFASETAILGQFEVGLGAIPGGGPMARLGRLAGRGRALEILLGGDDIPAVLAAQYGYVNRVIPDAEIEGFTDAFARRIAAFDKVAVAGIKKLVDVATLPEDTEFAPGLQAFLPPPGARRTSRSVSCSLRRASSSPTASRPIWAPRSGSCDRTFSGREAGGHALSVPSMRVLGTSPSAELSAHHGRDDPQREEGIWRERYPGHRLSRSRAPRGVMAAFEAAIVRCTTHRTLSCMRCTRGATGWS